MYGFTAKSSIRPSSTMSLINKINTLLRQIQMCVIIANRLERMSVPLHIVESTVFLMFLFQDDVFRILYHGGLHTKFYIIAIQGVDQANQIMDHLFCNHFSRKLQKSGLRKVVREIWFKKSGWRKVVDQKKRWFYTINPHFFRLEKSG